MPGPRSTGWRISASRAESERPIDIVADLVGSRTALAIGDQTWSGFLVDLQAALPAAAGARTVAAPERARQLLYTTDALDVAVNIHRRIRDAHLDITGQIYPSDSSEEALFSVQLLRGTSEIALTTTDDLGQFDLDAVEPGDYHMLLSAEEMGVMITPFEARL